MQQQFNLGSTAQKRAASLVLAYFTSAFAAVPASANLLVNGDFEWVPGYTGDWTIIGYGENVGHGSFVPSSSGAWEIVFNHVESAPTGALWQTFATVAGQDYVLSFDFGKFAFGPGTAALQLEVVSGGTVVLDQLVSDSTGGNTVALWKSYQFAFTATDASTTLRFTDRSSGTVGFDACLDNVVVVPAPGAAALLAAGGLFAGRRRRRR
jgi:hypothetical protein